MMVLNNFRKSPHCVGSIHLTIVIHEQAVV
jgi:hypothetical protein